MGVHPRQYTIAVEGVTAWQRNMTGLFPIV